MDFLVLTFIASFITLALFSLLLTAEERAGARLILGGLRRKMDQGFVVLNRRFFGIENTEQSAFRQTLHFVIHRCIKILLALVAKLESFLKKLQHVNRRAARVYRKKRDEGATTPELKEVAAHAQSIKLSDEEKREKRIAMLE